MLFANTEKKRGTSLYSFQTQTLRVTVLGIWLDLLINKTKMVRTLVLRRRFPTRAAQQQISIACYSKDGSSRHRWKFPPNSGWLPGVVHLLLASGELLPSELHGWGDSNPGKTREKVWKWEIERLWIITSRNQGKFNRIFFFFFVFHTDIYSWSFLKK